MVSGPRALHLPNLDLREAHLAAAALAARHEMTTSSSEEFRRKESHRRRRSQSLGDARSLNSETTSSYGMKKSNSSKISLLGEEIMNRKTPSGISLCMLDDEVDEVDHTTTTTSLNGKESKRSYGATNDTIQQIIKNETIHPIHYNEYEPSTPQMKESKSCTIPNLGVESCPYHRQESNATQSDALVEESNSIFLSILYGLVNTSIILPILMSFGSIIYHDDFFRPYLSVLMKLTVVSGAVHQITFSTVSTLPFAVGQVQDAGLIFLSAMARDLVSKLRAMNVDDESILATVTIGLSAYTAILGGALILVGRFKLASYCQLLPSSVVGGYLAYIGFFCGQASLALMASVDVTGLNEWYKFFDTNALILLAPGVVGGCMIYYCVGKYRHIAVLPTCIVMLMVIFYTLVWSMGLSVEEVTERGWINETVKSPAWDHTWDYFKVDKVVWRVLPSQTLTVLAMISVVALSSSLDIAAIEIEMKRPLDYNHELKTVGLSNVVSGLTGGYTGSYIFSQTIFSLRMGIHSPLMGYVIAFCSLVTVVIPFNILAYIPNFFFGSLLMLICLDLMFEWLVDVRKKVTLAEYVVVLMTFALLQVLGVEFGVLLGACTYVVIQKMGYDVGKNNEKLNEEDMALISYASER